MHGMCGNGGGCGGCGCNCQQLTPDQEKERLSQYREMLEKKLEMVKEQEAKLAEKK